MGGETGAVLNVYKLLGCVKLNFTTGQGDGGEAIRRIVRPFGRTNYAISIGIRRLAMIKPLVECRWWWPALLRN